ncbi:MAG: hypothetical protein ACRYF4_00480 [Janthinobacterium lividum]
MKKFRLALPVLFLLSIAASPLALRAQEQPAGTKGAASRSIASGDQSEPESVEHDPAEELKKPSTSVTKLGGMVGMKPDVSVLVFQWLNFLVLAVVVLYGLAKALPKAFRGRSENIQKSIVEARIATEEARARLGAVEARLGALDGEIAALHAENERAAAEEEQKMHAQAEEEKVRILASAEQEIASASAAAQRTLREYAAGIAVDHAAAQLQITPDDDRILIESFAKRLGTEGSRN